MTLQSNDGFRVAKYQLAKATTSMGANYEEAQAAESRSDFIHKIGIVLKESRESHYWLRVLRAIASTNPQQKQLDGFINEAAEFKKIFTSIKLTAQKNRSKK